MCNERRAAASLPLKKARRSCPSFAAHSVTGRKRAPRIKARHKSAARARQTGPQPSTAPLEPINCARHAACHSTNRSSTPRCCSRRVRARLLQRARAPKQRGAQPPTNGHTATLISQVSRPARSARPAASRRACAAARVRERAAMARAFFLVGRRPLSRSYGSTPPIAAPSPQSSPPAAP